MVKLLVASVGPSALPLNALPSRALPSSALILRGGGVAEPHAVIGGLTSNALALLVFSIATAAFSSQQSRREQLRVICINTVGGGLAYLIVYWLTGFMPMGFVPGASPVIGAFNPPA